MNQIEFIQIDGNLFNLMKIHLHYIFTQIFLN